MDLRTRRTTVAMVVSLVIVQAVCGLAQPIPAAQTPVPQQFLEFDKVTHQSAWNGQPAQFPIYAGRNGAKILYVLLGKAPAPEDVCVEVTTQYIGRFAKTDYQVKGNLMSIAKTAVPRPASDLALQVQATDAGYKLTITRGTDTLVANVPAPDDELDKLLKNPPANARETPIQKGVIKYFSGVEEKVEAEQAKTSNPAGGPSNAVAAAMPVASANKTFHSEVLPQLKKLQETQGSTIAVGPQQPPQGSGKKTFLPPFQDAGTRHENHNGWMASGIADKITGQVLSTTQGIGYSDAKKRGENYSWIQCKWNANKSGKLKATGTFVESHATGLSSPPVFAMATSTAYLYVGVRNERTQKDIWQEYSLGRSPGGVIPFVNILPLRQVTASGLDVQNGDEIVFMVGVCDYSSAKAGAHAHGEANARVQLIQVEVD